VTVDPVEPQQNGLVVDGPPSPALVARALLDRVVAYYAVHVDDANPEAPVPLPERRFVAGGEPRTIAWDVDNGQVHVAFERTIGGTDPLAGIPPAGRLPRANPANRGNLASTVSLEVQIVRAAPALGQLRALPTGDQLDRHGYALGLDMGHLRRAVLEAARDGYLTRRQVREAHVLIGDCVSVGPSGQVAAVAQSVSVPLL
jgi:hypothetical protein